MKTSADRPKIRVRGVGKSFRDRADGAAFMEAWVGMVLSRNGLHVTLFPFTYNDGKDHTHTWDIDVSKTSPRLNSCLPHAVEVKSTSHYFTGEADFQDFSGPNTVFISSKSAYIGKYYGNPNTPRNWLITSKKSGAVVWVPSGTPVLYTEILDPQRGPFQAACVSKGKLRSLVEFVEYING